MTNGIPNRLKALEELVAESDEIITEQEQLIELWKTAYTQQHSLAQNLLYITLTTCIICAILITYIYLH